MIKSPAYLSLQSCFFFSSPYGFHKPDTVWSVKEAERIMFPPPSFFHPLVLHMYFQATGYGSLGWHKGLRCFRCRGKDPGRLRSPDGKGQNWFWDHMRLMYLSLFSFYLISPFHVSPLNSSDIDRFSLRDCFVQICQMYVHAYIEHSTLHLMFN